MRYKKVDLVLFALSVVCFFFMALSFSLMALEFSSKDPMALLIGIMFWFFLMFGVLVQVFISIRRKKQVRHGRVKKNEVQKHIGLVCFFKNVYATVADIIFILSIIALTIAMVVTKGAGVICFPLISVVVFSFCMHCLLNGKNYNFLRMHNI